MDVKKHIQDRAASILPTLVDIRRHIHQNPELSFQEHETAALVEKELHSLGLKTQRLANTGVVAVICQSLRGSRYRRKKSIEKSCRTQSGYGCASHCGSERW